MAAPEDDTRDAPRPGDSRPAEDAAPPAGTGDTVARAAHRAAARAEAGRGDPEPSLGARLGQIGLLGWTIVVPTLAGAILGRWLDGLAGSGVFFSAPLIMLGAAFGLWSAWRWMHRNVSRDDP